MQELYQDKLKVIMEDELLIRALKAVFDDRAEKERPLVGDADSNNLLGEKYRAYEEAKIIIDQAFTDLLSYKIGKKPEESTNRAR